MLYAAVAIAVLVGAAAQRISGMGFALVAAPVLALLLGPFDGVLVVNLCGALSAAALTARVWRGIEWRRFATLVVPAMVALVPGAVIAATLRGPTLQITAGVFLICALTASLAAARLQARARSGPTAIVTGAASGLMSAVAGTSGPPMTIYAVLTRWDQRAFAATLQPFFVVLGVSSFVGKSVLAGGIPTEYSPWLWGAVVLSMAVGLLVGDVVARRIDPRVARMAVIVISYVGGLVVVFGGIRDLL